MVSFSFFHILFIVVVGFVGIVIAFALTMRYYMSSGTLKLYFFHLLLLKRH